MCARARPDGRSAGDGGAPAPRNAAVRARRRTSVGRRCPGAAPPKRAGDRGLGSDWIQPFPGLQSKRKCVFPTPTALSADWRRQVTPCSLRESAGTVCRTPESDGSSRPRPLLGEGGNRGRGGCWTNAPPAEAPSPPSCRTRKCGGTTPLGPYGRREPSEAGRICRSVSGESVPSADLKLK